MHKIIRVEQFNFNSIVRSTPYTALSTTATLALSKATGYQRLGVILANNNSLGGADIHVVFSSDFATAPSMTNPTFKLSPGNSVFAGAGNGVAIWVASSTGTSACVVSEVAV